MQQLFPLQSHLPLQPPFRLQPPLPLQPAISLQPPFPLEPPFPCLYCRGLTFEILFKDDNFDNIGKTTLPGSGSIIGKFWLDQKNLTEAIP